MGTRHTLGGLLDLPVGRDGLPAVLEKLSEANRRLEEANARMRRELRSAARVQQALLPAAHFRAPGAGIAWRLRPCEELAGDLLNCIRLDEHHLAFFVMDVSGHGVSSALLSVQVSRMMSPLMAESVLLKEPLQEPPWYRVVAPRRVVERLNRLFQMSTDLAQYFTMLYGVLDLRTGHLRFTSAGHPGPIHVPDGGRPAAVTCRSHPVGFFESSEYVEEELTLAEGDRIWIFSDGITEATDARERELGLDGLRDAVLEVRDLAVDDAADRVMETVEEWCRPGCPADDCTLLAIETRESS